jgi:hypothetical protein
MAFWFGILVGGFFVWFALSIGFYEVWAMLFNITISIYLAIYLRPIIVNIPAVGDTPYSNALTMIAIAIASFAILHGITSTFLTSQFKVSFPGIFNTLGTGFLGFLAGFLVWNFVSFLIFITPFSQEFLVKQIGFNNQLQQSNVSYLSWWCDLVNKVVSSRDSGYTTEQAVTGLLKSTESKAQVEPAKRAEPNDVEADVGEEERRGLPIETGIEDF